METGAVASPLLNLDTKRPCSRTIHSMCSCICDIVKDDWVSFIKHEVSTGQQACRESPDCLDQWIES